MPLKKPLRRNPSPYTCRDIDAAIAHLEAVLVSEGANRVFSRTYWRRRVLEAFATFGIAESQKQRLAHLLKRVDAS